MFNNPYISFFHLLVNGFSGTCFADPLPSINLWAVSVGCILREIPSEEVDVDYGLISRIDGFWWAPEIDFIKSLLKSG